MKMFALLLLVLPLPAFASDATDQLRLQQAGEARAACTAQNQGPSSSLYGRCVNAYLKSHYGWRVAVRPDGSLGVHVPDGGLPKYY